MIRALMMVVGCACATIVLVESGVLLVMWQKGYLDQHYLRELRLVFESAPEQTETEDPREKAETAVSLEEVARVRAMKVLDLEKRESDLEQLRRNVTTRAEELNEQQVLFRARKKEFEEELAKLKEQMQSAGTEQTRGVLLAMAPTDAAQKLMQISEAEGVRLLKGMPEKSIAKILKELALTPEQIERSHKLFDALGRGEPEVSKIEAAQQKNSSLPDETSPTK